MRIRNFRFLRYFAIIRILMNYRIFTNNLIGNIIAKKILAIDSTTKNAFEKTDDIFKLITALKNRKERINIRLFFLTHIFNLTMKISKIRIT